MTRLTREAISRLGDFKRRKDYSPGSVYVHASLGHEYIPIHPFSDETDILKKLKMAPSACTSVDAWWNLNSDVGLLGVFTTGLITDRQVGLYSGRPKDKEGYIYFMAVVDSDKISRTLFEKVMSKIHEYERIDFEKRHDEWPNALTYIGDAI